MGLGIAVAIDIIDRCDRMELRRSKPAVNEDLSVSLSRMDGFIFFFRNTLVVIDIPLMALDFFDAIKDWVSEVNGENVLA